MISRHLRHWWQLSSMIPRMAALPPARPSRHWGERPGNPKIGCGVIEPLARNAKLNITSVAESGPFKTDPRNANSTSVSSPRIEIRSQRRPARRTANRTSPARRISRRPQIARKTRIRPRRNRRPTPSAENAPRQKTEARDALADAP